MIFKELLKAIRFQITTDYAFRNIFITHNAFGIFSINSHVSSYSNKEKIVYNLESARKAAQSMEKKTGNHFSVYKCAYCTGYHIGKDAQ